LICMRKELDKSLPLLPQLITICFGYLNRYPLHRMILDDQVHSDASMSALRDTQNPPCMTIPITNPETNRFLTFPQFAQRTQVLSLRSLCAPNPAAFPNPVSPFNIVTAVKTTAHKSYMVGWRH